MAPSAPAPVAAAVERKRLRENPGATLREILIVMQASSDRPAGCPAALTDLGRFCDGRITGGAAYKVPAARNCAPALCRFCGMLFDNVLRSATALWNCSSTMLKAVSGPSSMAP